MRLRGTLDLSLGNLPLVPKLCLGTTPDFGTLFQLQSCITPSIGSSFETEFRRGGAFPNRVWE